MPARACPGVTVCRTRGQGSVLCPRPDPDHATSRNLSVQAWPKEEELLLKRQGRRQWSLGSPGPALHWAAGPRKPLLGPQSGFAASGSPARPLRGSVAPTARGLVQRSQPGTRSAQSAQVSAQLLLCCGPLTTPGGGPTFYPPPGPEPRSPRKGRERWLSRADCPTHLGWI